jgi:hypothetical protein
MTVTAFVRHSAYGQQRPVVGNHIEILLGKNKMKNKIN